MHTNKKDLPLGRGFPLEVDFEGEGFSCNFLTCFLYTHFIHRERERGMHIHQGIMHVSLIIMHYGVLV